MQIRQISLSALVSNRKIYELCGSFTVLIASNHRGDKTNLDGSILASKNMWATMSPHAMSPSAVVDARSENAPKLTSNNVIRSEDIAKIRKDAETAIENEFKILNHTKLPVLIPSNHRGYKTSYIFLIIQKFIAFYLLFSFIVLIFASRKVGRTTIWTRWIA